MGYSPWGRKESDTTEHANALIGHRRDFLGSPVVKTLPSNAGNAGSIPGQGANILPAL